MEAASRGEGGVVLLSGEPGVGKTRLMLEAAGHAQTQGRRVFLGRAYDSEGMPPYLPFSEALQDYVRLCPVEDLRAHLGDGASEVAALLWDVKRRLPDVPTSVPLDAASERYRLFESVSEFLLNIARATPAGLLLCLDDLHWADDSTLRLLEHMTRQLKDEPMLILATYRDTDLDAAQPLTRTLELLARQRLSQKLEIKRLGKGEVGSMLAALGKPDPPDLLVDAVFNETEGNPFFVQEVFEYLADEGRLFDADGSWRSDIVIGDRDVPQGVRLIIGRRLERLSEGCRRALSCAAVIGRTFSEELLQSLADLDEEALFGALEEAQRSHLLASDAEGRLTFSHELVRQTLLNDQSPARRQRLHLRAAEAIESAQEGDVEEHLAEIASHYRLAGAAADPAKAIDYATRAGDRSAFFGAFEEALRLYDMALEAQESRGTDGRAAVAELRVKHADALSGLGRMPEARAAFEAAAAGLNGARRADVLLMLANLSMRGTPDIPSDRRAASEAAAIARHLGRGDLEAGATAILAGCDLAEGAFKAALSGYERASSLGRHQQLPQQHQVFANFPLALYWAGRFEEAVACARDMVEAARRAKDAVWFVITSAHLGLALTASGRFSEALQAFSEARETARTFGAPGIRPVLARTVGMSVAVHLEAFDYGRAEAIAEEARDLGRSMSFILPVVSEGIDLISISIRRGDLTRAEELALEVEEQLDRGGGAHGILWRTRLAAARADLALARNDWRKGLNLSDEALELARTIGRPKYESRAHASRGAALGGLGRKREALSSLRSAVEVVRPIGDPAMFLRAAAALLAVEGDDALAADALQAAGRILENLPDGMKGIFEAAEPVQLVYKMTGPKASRSLPARPSYPHGLSERQLEVLRLVAQGRTNREIAGELVLSERTVQRHIADLYAKIGARNRAEATAIALETL